MFGLAIIIGLFSYSVFFLGITRKLTLQNILLDTTAFVVLLLIYLWIQKDSFSTAFRKFFQKADKFFYFLLGLLIFQAIINFIGTLGPELAFDALWYHLTLPKVYVANQGIAYIPGNLLYYSAMPQLTEMFYVVAIALQGELIAKVMHFLFGILTCIALYLSGIRIVKNKLAALFAVVIFYANLVVGWESITAFSDLALAFFTTMSLWSLMLWLLEKKQRWMYISAILLGFAISTKLLAFGTLGIMGILLVVVLWKRKCSLIVIGKSLVIYVLFSLMVVLPWLLFAFINTGNPFFPFFSKLNPVAGSYIAFDPTTVISDTWYIFITGADPILPIYLLVLPLLFVVRRKITFPISVLCLFCGLSYLFWLLLPKIGGGRFLLPYLPSFSLLASFIILSLKDNYLKNYIIGIVVLLALSSIAYRGVANAKYASVLIGKESKSQFLRDNLNFSFGDFYDIDGYFAKHITKKDTVLLYGFHNLYYVDFPYVHESWVMKGDAFNYIAVQHGDIPLEYKSATLIYKNPITQVKLYNFGTR